jgi:hypothetical protein
MDDIDTPYCDKESGEPKVRSNNTFAAKLVKLSHHRAQGPFYYKLKNRSRSLNKYPTRRFNYLRTLEDIYSCNVPILISIDRRRN